MSTLMLGKQAPKIDSRTLLLANYLKPELPDAPVKYAWEPKIDHAPDGTIWGMMKNDTVGDCTCASAGHMILGWTADNGKEFRPSDEDILAAYAAVSDYDPSTGEGDNGAFELDVLNLWRKHGIAGHKIKAYAALEPSNKNHVKQAVFLFGGCYIGLQLPVSAQSQEVWSVPPGGLKGDGQPGSWGGHAVNVIGFSTDGLLLITWGHIKRMTWQFWDAYCDEAYAILSQDFTEKGAKAPNHVNVDQLLADLHAVTH